MKRTAIFLLVLALFLTACSHTPTPGPTEALVSTTALIPVPTQPTTEAVTVPTPEPTTEPTTEPTEPPPPETEPPAPETTEPTPTTWQVHTDWSAYEPYAGSGVKYTRLHPGVLDHFEPSGDYGMVFPYVAAAQTLDDDYDSEVHLTYGFADRNGRLLTDGIYYNAELVRVGDPEPRYYWKVSQMIDMDTFWEQFPGVESNEWDARLPEVYGLISLDGSVVLDCAYPELEGMGSGFLCGNGGEGFDFTVLNADLEPLLTGEDVFGGVECDRYRLEYGDGLYLAYTANKHYTDTEYWEGYELTDEVYWFCDETGTRVLGPYAGASTFHEGLACVSTDGEHYGYIDKTGAWILQPVYTWSRDEADFRDGRAIQCREDGAEVVLDRDGRELLRQDSGYLSREDCGFRMICQMRIDGVLCEYRDYYDPDGNLLASGSENLRCLDAGTFAEYSNSAHTVRIFTPERTLLTLEMRIPDWRTLEKGVLMRDGYLLMGWYVGTRYFSEGDRFFLTADFSDMSDAPEVKYPYVLYKYGSRYTPDAVRDQVTGKDWYFCWTGTAWEGRTESGSRITVPLRSEIPAVVGDMVCAFTDRASYLLKPDGEIVFCCPFDGGD